MLLRQQCSLIYRLLGHIEDRKSLDTCAVGLIAVQRVRQSSSDAAKGHENGNIPDGMDGSTASPSRIPSGQAPASQGVREQMMRTWKTRKSLERQRQKEDGSISRAKMLSEPQLPKDEQGSAAGG